MMCNMSQLPPPPAHHGDGSDNEPALTSSGYVSFPPPTVAAFDPATVPLPTGGLADTPLTRQVNVADIGMHVRRAFGSGIRTIRPSAVEQQRLVASGITDPLMQGYSAWRHSLLLVAAPASLVSGVLATIALFTEVESEGFSGLGVVAQVAPYLAVIVLTLSTLVALARWSAPHSSSKLLGVGWAVSLAVPVLVAMIPIDWLLDAEAKSQLGPEALLTIRFIVGFAYAINLLPTLLSFPSGVIRGATRVKAMLPASTMSGWALMMLAPLYTLFFVVALILMDQLAGNPLLLIGTLLIASTPFVHVAVSKLYVQPLTAEVQLRALDRAQRRAGVVSLSGVLLLVIWALTTDTLGIRVVGGGGDAMLSPFIAVLRVVEFIARLLITTAVFSHLLLQFTEAQWRHDRVFVQDPTFAHHELQMAQVEHTLRVTGDRAG